LDQAAHASRSRNVVEDDDDDSDFDPNDSDDDQSVNSDDESYADNVREVDANPVQYQHTGHVAGVYPTQNAQPQQHNAQPNPGNNQPDDDSDDDSNDNSDEDSDGGADETGADQGVHNDEENGIGAEQGVSETESDGDGNGNDDVPEEEDGLESKMDLLYGPRSSGYDLRQRKNRSYGHLHVTNSDRSRQSAYKAAALDAMVDDFYAPAFLQHSMKSGIKQFGDCGTEAVRRVATAPRSTRLGANAPRTTYRSRKEPRAGIPHVPEGET
jgi:hypothetical protein